MVGLQNLVFLLAAYLSVSASAEQFSIVNVGIVRSGGYAFIDVTPDISSPTSCSRKNQIRWEIGTDTDKAILSLAITAKASASKLDIMFIENDCLGDSPRPNVVRLTGN